MSTASDSVQDNAASRLDAPDQSRPNRRKRGLLITGVFVVAGAAVATAVWAVTDDPDKPPAAAPVQVNLATVKRQSLEQHTELDGKLGYQGTYEVVNQARGVITKLPSVGDVIKSGKVLYRVDGKPVVFLEGSRAPAYRSLSEGMSGSDVQQLNAALVDLNYDDSYGPSADSRYFSTATRDALERLQDAVNVDETGTLELGQAVFLPASKVRITAKNGTYGAAAPAGRSVLKASSTTLKVSINMDASLAPEVKVGDKVTVAMPNGKQAAGSVMSVGRVATTTDSGSTVPVDVKLSNAKSTGGLDAASVKVSISSGGAKNVLAVPVTALLAMAGGGYSVEVVQPDNSHRLVPVTTGMFDDAAGLVEVSGPGLADGQRVVVPAS